ncbi:hypothetical protein GC197_12800 [bacterium]|nr:hypothetical protein [bacterium]
MLPLRHQLLPASLAKRVVTLLLLGTMLAWGSGISVAVPGFKDPSTPFMCQDHACSCRNATGCWNHCCCFSQSEKLAWALEHKVEPPETFLKAVAQEKKASSEFCGEKELRPDVYAALCSLRGFDRQANSSHACSAGSSCKTHASAKSTDGSCNNTVSLVNAMNCHAIGSVILMFSPVLEFELGSGELVAINSNALQQDSLLRPDSYQAAPEPPPPRV